MKLLKVFTIHTLVLCLCFGVVALPAQSLGVRLALDAIVLDPSGNAVPNLAPDRFTLREGGEIRTIHKVSPVSTPWSVLMMFDHNLTWLQGNGTRSTDRDVTAMWQSLGKGITRFLGSLAPADRISMAAFEDKIDIMLDWRNARTGQLQEIPLNPLLRPPTGDKDVYGAIRWAIDKLKAETGRKAAIIFTDGRDARLAPRWLSNGNRDEVLDPLYGVTDTAEASEFVEVMDAVAASGVRFYFIMVTSAQAPDFRGRPISRLFPGSDEAVNSYLLKIRTRMEKLAESSGGNVIYSQTPAVAIESYQNLYQALQLGNRYTLEYTSGRQPGAPASQPTVEVADRALRVFPTEPIALP
jgi:hypothetical protein